MRQKRGCPVPFAHIYPINEDLTIGRIIRPVHQFGHRGLARTGLPDNGDGFPWFGPKRDITQQIAATVAMPEAERLQTPTYCPVIAALYPAAL